MTDITIKKQGKCIVEVVAEGHTGYGEAGEDIVCAGVSTLLQSALLGLLQVVQINVKFSVNEETGSLRFTLPQKLTPQERHDADVVLNTMLCGLQDLYTEYSDYINLEVI
ncbi:MAG: ribosomal-processing cysteine protease Prp [Clostridia bacterium]|nr:ribosomal-processing cysteine protease Prp [Clostridia bacterium]MBQ7914919.1 ribosomal-processing cysteine protease Prp [Clostridia bacterium]MBQ8505459.1 ribosomal-processing cysteine protease Prp [Clostridia bacterium]MBQ8772603.1 ribosomal-processing cysteine protease Prp [Clostridia bacterium]MBQ8873248.1 ribosomal-processing cysteine protease Prp [Clostridia bacterium]